MVDMLRLMIEREGNITLINKIETDMQGKSYLLVFIINVGLQVINGIKMIIIHKEQLVQLRGLMERLVQQEPPRSWDLGLTWIEHDRGLPALIAGSSREGMGKQEPSPYYTHISPPSSLFECLRRAVAHREVQTAICRAHNLFVEPAIISLPLSLSLLLYTSFLSSSSRPQREWREIICLKMTSQCSSSPSIAQRKAQRGGAVIEG